MADEKDNIDALESDDVVDMERLLASFAPRCPSTNNARLLFLAGRESAAVDLAHYRRRHRWFWPCCTAATTILAATFAILLAVLPEAAIRIVEQPAPALQPTTDSAATVDPADKAAGNVNNEATVDHAIVPQQAPRARLATESPSLARSSYLHTRDLVLRHGFEAIPSFKQTGAAAEHEATSMQALRQTLVPRSVDTPADASRSKSIWPSIIFDGENL